MEIVKLWQSWVMNNRIGAAGGFLCAETMVQGNVAFCEA